MQLASPDATDTKPADRDPGGAHQSLARTALLGFFGSAAIVTGAVMGGQSFDTHLPGAWYFGMPGGLFGSTERPVRCPRLRRWRSSSVGSSC